MKKSLRKPGKQLNKSPKDPSKSKITEESDLFVNVLAHSSAINHLVHSSNNNLRKIVDITMQCKQSLLTISKEGSESIEDALSRKKALIKEFRSSIDKEMKKQDDVNEKLYRQIDQLKREKTEIQWLILSSAKVCRELERELGRYPKSDANDQI